jgi:ornithine cyclodeaminase/alanine dehydrogenase-like protein (mu-crystallin family)
MSEHVIVTVSEAVCQQVLTRADAFDAVEAVFGAMARGDARNFPVVREALAKGGPLYGFKSGYDARGQVLGVKSGGYFPGNDERGLTNHQSHGCRQRHIDQTSGAGECEDSRDGRGRASIHVPTARRRRTARL